MTTRASPRRRRSRDAAGRGRRGRGVSSPGRRDRIWRGPMTRTSGATVFPPGRCDCGADLAAAADLGVVDRYQQHEIPQVAVRITQYDQHEVACGCGRTAHRRPPRRCPARPGRVRPEPGRVRGLPDGGALRARAPGGRAAGVVDRDRAVGRVRARHARPHRRAAGRGARPDPHPDHPGVRGVLRRDPAAGRAAHPAAGEEQGRAVPAGGLHRAVHPLPARRPLPGHVQGVRAHRARAARRGGRARPLPELRLRRVRRAGPPALLPASTA